MEISGTEHEAAGAAPAEGDEWRKFTSRDSLVSRQHSTQQSEVIEGSKGSSTWEQGINLYQSPPSKLSYLANLNNAQ